MAEQHPYGVNKANSQSNQNRPECIGWQHITRVKFQEFHYAHLAGKHIQARRMTNIIASNKTMGPICIDV